VVIASLCLALALGGDTLRLWARYERSGLEHGEAWRLLTGHLVHLGFGHLWPNLLALGLIGWLLEGEVTPLEWLVASLAAALAIDAGLYTLDPEVQWYVGLSGVLHGYVAYGAWRLLGQGSKLGAVLAAGLAAKLALEHWWGPIPMTEASAGGPVIVAAHLYGSVGGLAAAACFSVLRRRDSRL
jgi:rhomboid family GlyGly-CTERM serine protease